MISNTSCLPGCSPAQVINFKYAFNFEELDKLTIFNGECAYDNSDIEWAYSVDSVCWSCYNSYNDMLTTTIGIDKDFFIRAKLKGTVTSVKINCEEFNDYTTSLYSGFNFTAIENATNLYNPYANMDGAIALQQQLTENISNMIGIPIYYFKLSPNTGSKDITFKEYALMDVDAVKQIKLIISDGQMPSSKPEFSEFGFDWSSDWETEISKSTFATAFGKNAQPMEGDLIYIPMMKRMWMVNEAYEEKKDALMWNATTFKTMLVKYQEKASVDLGDTESLVNTFVKNKYEDLFGDQESVDSGVEALDTPIYAANRLYPIYESDATRKYMTCDPIDYYEHSTYYKGTLISDLMYKFNIAMGESKIIYQRQYCGDSGTISFIIKPTVAEHEGKLIEIGNLTINISQTSDKCKLTLLNNGKELLLGANELYFVYVRWSKAMNNIEMFAARYTYNQNVPLYKLQPHHYFYDVDNAMGNLSRWNIEMVQSEKQDVILYGFGGYLTNFKLFDVYNDNISEIMQMYPNHQHLIINDTARKILDLPGVSLR